MFRTVALTAGLFVVPALALLSCVSAPPSDNEVGVAVTPSSYLGYGFSPRVGACQVVGGQNLPPPWCGASQADVQTLLTAVKATGATQIRTFGSGPWTGTYQNSDQWTVPAAAAVGGLGVWACAALLPGNDTVSQQEINAVIQQAQANPGVVKGLIVGVEPVGLQGYTPAQVVAFMNYAKQQRDAAGFTSATLPVTTSEQLGVLAGAANLAIPQACEGVVLANTYPSLACGVTIETAISDPNWGLAAQYNVLKSFLAANGLGSLQIMIGETGWPSAGNTPTPPGGCPGGTTVPPASASSQQSYVQQVGAWAAQNQVQVFLFEAFSESWKATPTCSTSSIDMWWGILPLPGGLNISPPYGQCQTSANP